MLVNAYNRSCLNGTGGNDRAVSARGGAALKAAREALPLVGPKAQQTRCKPGGAVITVGGGLGAKWCVHAVGPDYRSEKGAEGEPLSREACDRLVGRAHVQARPHISPISPLYLPDISPMSPSISPSISPPSR